VLVRVSWTGESVTIRAGLVGDELQLVRVAPFEATAPVFAGPLACAPTRSGLSVRFHAWRFGAADASLHP
jgi:regulation of enolase protein 1 (concanavalin A-like superfamily)